MEATKTSPTAESSATHQRVVVDDKKEVADGVVELVLGPAAGEALPDWSPGSHIDLHLPDGLVRQYSLLPRASGKKWRVAVLREASSRGGSRFVHDDVEVGDELETSGPRNNFAVAFTDQHLFLAGGIGITPLVSMIEEVDVRGAEWSLVYCGRSRPAMAFVSELEERWPHRVTVNPDDESGIFDIADHLRHPILDATVYACGPTSLLDAARTATGNWPPGALRVERFSTDGQASAGPDRAFDVELRASGMTITVPPGRTILQAVRDAGVGAASSCEEGTCGSCETRVCNGEVEHRDVVLSPREQTESTRMMICVSRARGSRLTLDL